MKPQVRLTFYFCPQGMPSPSILRFPLFKRRIQKLDQWSSLAGHTASRTAHDNSRVLSCDVGRLGQLSSLWPPRDVLPCQGAVQAASPDSHNHACGHGEGKSHSLSSCDTGLLCLCLHLIGISPVGTGEVNNISIFELTGVKNDVSILIILLGLQVVNEVTDLLFISFLIKGLCTKEKNERKA